MQTETQDARLWIYASGQHDQGAETLTTHDTWETARAEMRAELLQDAAPAWVVENCNAQDEGTEMHADSPSKFYRVIGL
jgi:hypothetical protein